MGVGLAVVCCAREEKEEWEAVRSFRTVVGRGVEVVKECSTVVRPPVVRPPLVHGSCVGDNGFIGSSPKLLKIYS